MTHPTPDDIPVFFTVALAGVFIRLAILLLGTFVARINLR